MGIFNKYNNIENLTKKLRRRLIEYRYASKDKEVSLHVNAAEMAVCLVELALDKTPHPISKEEETWFKAAYYLDYVFPSGYEWHDISELYGKLADEVEKMNFLRDS